jgi:hypothetical protein
MAAIAIWIDLGWSCRRIEGICMTQIYAFSNDATRQFGGRRGV